MAKNKQHARFPTGGTALEKLLLEAAERCGVGLSHYEDLTQGPKGALRVYLDSLEGTIGIGDCTQYSSVLSALLDAEDLIKHQYNLEVSSPGMDRPLFNQDHYRRFKGEHAVLVRRLAPDENGPAKIKGTLGDLTEAELTFHLNDSEHLLIPFGDIVSVRLDPQFQAALKETSK